MKNKGFTLLELLVVIGIMGVMMALSTVAYTSAQKNGRDSRRRQDLVAMQNALEQYYSSNSFSYPGVTCSDAATYMKSNWPSDPNGVMPYVYNETCGGTNYCICTQLENTSAGNSSDTNCNWSTATTKPFYCVGNLQ